MASHKEEEKPLLFRTREEVSWHRGGGGGEGGVEERADPANASASQVVEPTKTKVRKLAQGTSGGQAVAPCDLIYGGHRRGGVPRSEEEKERVRPVGQPSLEASHET